MKKTALTAFLAVLAALGAYAQGTIAIDNQYNTNVTQAGAPSSGGVFNLDVPDTGNWNISLLGGSSPSNLVLIGTLLQSSGQILSGTAVGAPGIWIDVTGQSYVVPGVAADSIGYFQVEAWEGNYDSFTAAISSGAVRANASPVFQNLTGDAFILPDLRGMPSFSIVVVPEPTTLALCGLGAASLLLARRKK
jgi:hypothetical protein